MTPFLGSGNMSVMLRSRFSGSRGPLNSSVVGRACILRILLSGLAAFSAFLLIGCAPKGIATLHVSGPGDPAVYRIAQTKLPSSGQIVALKADLFNPKTGERSSLSFSKVSWGSSGQIERDVNETATGLKDGSTWIDCYDCGGIPQMHLDHAAALLRYYKVSEAIIALCTTQSRPAQPVVRADARP